MRHTYIFAVTACMALTVFGLSSCSETEAADGGETGFSTTTAATAEVTSAYSQAEIVQTSLTTSSETVPETEVTVLSEASGTTASEKKSESTVQTGEVTKKAETSAAEETEKSSDIISETEVFDDKEEDTEILEDEEAETGAETELIYEAESAAVSQQYQGYYPPMSPSDALPPYQTAEPESGVVIPAESEPTSEKVGSVTNENGDILLPEVP